jgi:glucose-1-phosphate thymidylyltransferase
VTLEPFTVIGDAIIMDDSAIGSHSRIVDTITGERCHLADHTSTCTESGLIEIEGIATRSEFGAIIGDTVTSGPFTIFKNSIIGNNVTIEGHGSLRSRYIFDNSTVI